MTLGRPEIQRLLHDNGLRPRRSLGQNFVADPNTVRRIVRLAGVTAGSRVVELGAGLGSLTLALAETGAQVVAVEVDPALCRVLGTVLADAGLTGGPGPGPGTVTVVEADALRLDWDRLLGAGDEPWQVVGNLPYNVAVPIVLRVLEAAPRVLSLLVMAQREVGERLAAAVGDPAYGAVSVRVGYWATAAVVGRVPASVFVPRPSVESVLVRLDRRGAPAVPESVVTYDRFCAVVRAGFAQRRKMLRRSLAGSVAPEAFAAAGVSAEARAETLDVEHWGRLAGWREEER